MRKRHISTATVAVCLLGSALGAAPAQADAADAADATGGRAIDHASVTVSGPLATAKGPVTFFVRTKGAGALAVDAKAKGGQLTGRKQSSAARDRVASINRATDGIEQAARGRYAKTKVVYVSRYTVPGIAMTADAATARALAARSDVVSVTPLVPKTIVKPVATAASTAAHGEAVSPANSASDIYTRSLDAWQQTGRTGKGVNIAVIDTGLDYTHADFGGPGTAAAYQAALATTAAPDPSLYDSAKYLGGYDFAGPTYSVTPGPAYDALAQPDANPVDGPGGSHGTHVAGTAAGFGVSGDSTTFTGDYGQLTADSLTGMKIGPGTAPEAGLYALKVFGDNGGSTNLTGEALDWVGKSLTEGKKINVVNLSLGSDYSAADDPDNAKIDALADQGVLPVVAAGNAADRTDIGGSPGSSAKALTVAASESGYSSFDGVDVSAPGDLAATGPYTSQYSVNYAGSLPVSGDVVTLSEPANLNGCAAYDTEDLDRVKGKVVWLEWDDTDVACGSGARFTRAYMAGAVGVLLPSTLDSFDAGIAGSTTVPGAQLTRASTEALRPAAEAGTLHVSFRSELRSFTIRRNPALADTLAEFSSRGVHGSYDAVVKPDVSAPGVNVVSAGRGTGTKSATMSGTSMATPHTAGIAALVFQAHPRWNAIQVKAGIMNTATHDVRDAAGTVYSQLRQGTGRVDALQAVDNSVTVESPGNGGLVTASFGVVEVPGTGLTRTRTLTVTNTGDSAVSYRLAYTPRTTIPGVTYTLSDTYLSVPAKGQATVRVTLSVPDPTALRRPMDPTQTAATLDGLPRDYVSDASGVVEFTPTTPTTPTTSGAGTTPLRLGVFSAPKPVAAMHGSAVTFADSKATTAALTLAGTALAQGADDPTAYNSLVAPFVLGATSPKKTFPAGSAAQTLSGLDIRAAGAASTAPLLSHPSDGVIAFGVQTQGPTADPGTTGYPVIEIDTDADGTPDFLTFLGKDSTVDLTVAVTIDAVLGTTVDIEPLNANYGGVDTNTFDSDVTVLPVSLKALGYTDTTRQTKLRYTATTMSLYAPAASTGGSQIVDTTKTVTFDVFKPALWFGKKGSASATSLLFHDTAGTVPVHRAIQNDAASVLLLHLHNASGLRGQIVKVSTVKTLAPLSGKGPKITGTAKAGRRLVADPGTWNPSGASFTYQWLRSGKPISGATSSSYRITGKDVGHRLSVRVVATKKGTNPGTATSPRTNTVKR